MKRKNYFKTFSVFFMLMLLTGCMTEADSGSNGDNGQVTNPTESKATYTITFDANGGSGEMKAQTAESGSEITLPKNTFIKTGYSFAGWATSAGGNIVHKDGAKIKLTENLTLYAQWTAGTETAYKVEHWQQNVADNGYTLAKTESMTGTTGAETTAKAEETAGFTAKEFAQAKIAADGSTVVKIYYDRKNITLTFDADNGKDKITFSRKFGADVKIDAPTKIGYTFADWNPELPATFPAEDAQYTAKWVKEGDYIITYKNAENAVNDNPAGYNVETETITLKAATKAGYTFAGWYKEDSFATKVPEIAKGSTGNITLYAKWLKTYTITYELNGDEANPAQNAVTNPTEYNIETAVTLADPERSFYEFAGWYDNTEFSGDKLTGWNAGEKTGNITLYAKWAVTAANISEAIKNIPADGKVHTVMLAGEISEDTIFAIRSALYENSDAKINLDMSGTTGLTKIPDYAFYDADKNAGCKALAGIVLPEGIESINRGAFQLCTDLTDIVIPDSVKTIGKFAFYSVSFASIKFGSRLESIGEYAFNYCNSLTEITVSGNVKTIGYMAFDCCSNLEKVVLEEGVQTIGEYAFSGCEKLASVTIPKSVTSIGDYAFSYCDALQTVNYGGTVAEWNALKADIDAHNENLLNAAIYCTDGTVITADKASKLIASLESGEYNIAVTGAITGETISAIKTALQSNENAKVSLDLSQTTGLTSIGDTAFKDCSSLTSVNIPDSVTSIGIRAFKDCSSLTSVNIPDSVTSIDVCAFYGCSGLTSLNIPSSVASIEWGITAGCTSLTELTVSENNSAYKSYENCIYTKDGTTLMAAAGCLTSVTILNSVTAIYSYAFQNSSSLTNVIIPASVTSIGANAFSYCTNLTSVTFPTSVTSIMVYAFDKCSSLTTVNFEGTVDQWNEITIAKGNDPLKNATVNYNYTGE